MWPVRWQFNSASSPQNLMIYNLSPDMAERLWYEANQPNAIVNEENRQYHWLLGFGVLRREPVKPPLEENYGHYEYMLEVDEEKEAEFAMVLLSLGVVPRVKFVRFFSSPLFPTIWLGGQK